MPASLAQFTANLADELALAYNDHAVYPRRTVVDRPGTADRHFPGWATPVLVLAVENQGVCAWGVPLDGDDNPPVVVGGDVGGGTDTTVRYAADVRAYVRSRRWDHACLSSSPLVQAQAQPLDPATLASLRSRFDEVPSTMGWPGEVTYRFRTSAVRIMLWSGPDQCDWWISGTDIGRLAETTAALLPYSDLRSSLWSNDVAVQTLVDEVRRTH